MKNEFSIFAEHDLYSELAAMIDELKRKISGETPEYLLNVNDERYLDYLENDFKIDPLLLHFYKLTVSDREERILAERFPNRGFDFNVERGRSYPKHVVTYHLPFSGEAKLLRSTPSNRLLWTTNVYIEGGCVCFDIIDFYGDASRVKSEAESILKNIGQQLENVTKQVAQYNHSLRSIAAEALARRRQELGNRHTVLRSLGVPIRKSSSTPETFVVPPVRNKAVSKPAAVETAGPPVPTLDDAVYQEILKTIYDMGKTFERYPSTYAGKDEETLRDHLILQLEPRFEGSTTGETFNKSGKTDILIRYEKSNVFVAECKFWDGKVQHFKTIDQILSYLTWRDSKTAIIYFVNRKEISSVLKEISEQTPQHSCFLASLPPTSSISWQPFDFHLPSDRGCKIRITVLAFHIPPTK
jgi:hypothetical protein